jgi:cell division protein FtsB
MKQQFLALLFFILCGLTVETSTVNGDEKPQPSSAFLEATREMVRIEAMLADPTTREAEKPALRKQHDLLHRLTYELYEEGTKRQAAEKQIVELQAMNGKLQAMNDKLQAMNDKLQATNLALVAEIKSLQATNAQLQAQVRDLATTVEELRHRIDDLSRQPQPQPAPQVRPLLPFAPPFMPTIPLTPTTPPLPLLPRPF